MADLFEAFKSALSQAGPGLVAQMQGKDQLAMQMYKAGANQAQLQRREKDRQFSNELKMRDMALTIQKAKDSAAINRSKNERDQQLFELKMQAAREGRVDDTKMQQVRDTYNAETNNPVSFDPSRRDNSLIDSITGQPVKKVYTGVQGRFEAKESRAISKDIAKEMERQTPVKTVLNSLDVLEEILQRGEAAVESTEPILGTKLGFTGKARNALQVLQRQSGMFDTDEVDENFEQFSSFSTQVLAQQVRSFTGAQATDAEREFLAQMGPRPNYSPAVNRIKIRELRKMMKFIDDRNAAISARLGKPVANISEQIGPGQDLMSHYYNNVKEEGSDMIQDSLNIDQQQKMSRYLELERRKIQLLKQLPSGEK